MANALRHVIDQAVISKTEIMVAIRGSQQQLTPGTVEKWELPSPSDTIQVVGTPEDLGLYRLLTKAMAGTNPQNAHEITVPIVFSVEDVLWVVEVPKNAHEQPAIVSPGGRRTPGGLHIGG